MKWLLPLVVLAACGAEDSGGGYPINPGGGGSGSGSGSHVDGGRGDDGGSTTINGRVCVLTTALDLSSCASTGAGGLTVTLANATATTSADGSFTLTRTGTTAGLMWVVTGTTIKRTAVRYASTTTIPVFTLTKYEEMVSAMQATETSGQGALIARISRAGSPVSGATVAVQPTPDSLIYYDGSSASDWQTGMTGAAGLAWIPSIPVSGIDLTITAGSTPTTITGDPVFNASVTFVLAELP